MVKNSTVKSYCFSPRVFTGIYAAPNPLYAGTFTVARNTTVQENIWLKYITGMDNISVREIWPIEKKIENNDVAWL